MCIENVTKCHACHTKRPLLKPSKRRGFAASRIGTATPEQNRRSETKRVGGSNRAFRMRLPQIFTVCLATKSTSSYEFSPKIGYLTWPFPLLKNIGRFAQSGVSSNLWSYRAFPQKNKGGMSWKCFPSAGPSSQSSHNIAFKMQGRTSKLVCV